MSQLTRLDIICPQDAPNTQDAVSGVLARLISFGWEEQDLPDGACLFRLHLDNAALAKEVEAELAQFAPLAAISHEAVDNQDWTKAWRSYFTPVDAGRFVVLPPWLHPLPADNPLHGKQPIVIEPKSAFGTGHHFSTVLCLKAIDLLLAKGRISKAMRFMDLGTGSGILGIGAALNGLSGLGADIDPIAVDNARENVRINQVDGAMQVVDGGLEAFADTGFDLVIANILAEPLREMAPELMARMKPGGALILSGLLTTQAAAVEACYASLGKAQHLVEGDWTALVWD